MDDFWKRIYEVMMTPLPPPKQLELDRLFEALRGMKTPEVGELPVAPEWVQRYARERGLDRPQAIQPEQQPQQGLYEALGGNSAQGLSR